MVIKRISDIIISLLGIIILLPVLLIISVLIYFKLGSPIFFVQERVGKDNKIFKMIKFRSMKDIKDKDGNMLLDSERLTNFGKKIRSLSLDELPELINILKGDMSLIGPRPLLVEYLELYDEDQIQRHNMRPGLTGWAQINGRNSINWSEKFRHDVWYIKNWTLRLDIKIFFMTIKTVIKKDGINYDDTCTMQYFDGSN